MSKFDDEILSRLLTYFSSSYSLNGKLKLLETLDSSMNVLTSRSSRVIRTLKCRRTISRLVIGAMEKQVSLHDDGGLYYAMIFTRFLKEIRQNPTKLVDLQLCLNLIEKFENDFQPIEFDSIGPLLALVRAVICKPLAFNYSKQIREEICLLTVKSFLEKLTSIDQHVLTIESLPIENSKLFVGLLFPIYSPKNFICSKRIRPCLYFTISLAGDHLIENVDALETREEIFQWIQNVAERLTETILKISHLKTGGVVLCQKVIHPSIKIRLKQNGIDTIDRLSQQFSSLFCSLTGCRPIESVNFDVLDQRYFGTITEIQQIQILDKQFLLFINENRPVHTLLLCGPSEQSLLELKECVRASENILMKTLKTKKAFYGAGCCESRQIFQLRQQIPSLSVDFLCRTLVHLLRCQYEKNLVVDLFHGHLWFLSENDEISSFCACEFYRSNEKFRNDWKTHVFFLDLDEQIFQRNDDDDDEFVEKENSPKFLDSFSMKSQTMKNAVETAINLYLTNVYL